MGKSKYIKAIELERKLKSFCASIQITTQVGKDGNEYYDCWIIKNKKVEHIQEKNWWKFKAIVLEKVLDLCIKGGK